MPVEAALVPPRLTFVGVEAGYGAAPVVRGVSASVAAAEIAAVIGPNGSGKSTLLKALSGGLEVSGGRVCLDGGDVTNLRRDVLARRGMVYVPQENEVFRSLSVRDNLAVGGYLLARRQLPAALDVVYERFPWLASKRSTAAGNLSGGERRLLALARVMLVRAAVVVLDEPSAGLSPGASEDLLGSTVPSLAADGAAVVVVEQRALQALGIAHWAYVMVAGTFAAQGPAAKIAARPDIGDLFLGRSIEDPLVEQF